ncbi:MAG: PepSY domain-containing protein [Hyphomicrobiaceae bacterium]
MTKKLRMSTAAVALLITAVAASAGAYASEDEGEMQALKAAKVTLVDAIQAAEQKSGGKAYDAAIKTDEGAPMYVVEVFSNDKIAKVSVDTQSGEVKNVETLSEDMDGDGDGQ